MKEISIDDTIANLMQANLLEVFNQRDHAARQAAIMRIYADDVRWTDDDGVTVGRVALDAKAVERKRFLTIFSSSRPDPLIRRWGLATWRSMWSSRVALCRRSRVSTSRSCAMVSSPSSTPC